MLKIVRDAYETVLQAVMAAGLLVEMLIVALGLFVVSTVLSIPLWLLGLPMIWAGYAAAAVVGVAGFAAILYGGYRFIDW